MHFLSVLFQEAIGLAHPLNECKPRKDGKQQTQVMRVLKGLSRMKAKGSPRGELCLRAGETQRLREHCLQGKEWERKSTWCAWKCRKYIKGSFIILFMNLERIIDRYAVIKANKLTITMRYLIIPGKTRGLYSTGNIFIFYFLAQKWKQFRHNTINTKHWFTGMVTELHREE